MATSPRDPLGYPPESRAPPPSPVAEPLADGSEAPGDEELAGFLSQSLRIPELNLPDRIFPRNPAPWNPPEIDFRAMVSPENDGSAVELLKSTGSAFGCFQLVNHGIPRDLIAAGEVAAAAAFSIPPEKKKAAARSPERRWGFEVEEEEEGGEELLWYRNDMGEILAGIWTPGYKDFSDKIVRLWMEIERIASKIGEILLEDGARGTQSCSQRRSEEVAEGSVLCLHKHGQNNSVGGLKNEVLRMVIRSSGCSHTLTLHLCCRATEFHVYSKRGWFRFCPNNEAIVVTIGNQIQVIVLHAVVGFTGR
ncbi:uncharacterized protein LOC103722022 isoform X2 [Phoenix dactylifera]|uniref:Uncharacterized protein LOC103722022 isoform X2 n=1 Tax=Phoenix dactylifera TaxID=42345 RepID=A0A8B9APW7_PHODC|nr:uncharacterized protein LOC103722022 isoform X2 [Phoenix dactylifera]